MPKSGGGAINAVPSIAAATIAAATIAVATAQHRQHHRQHHHQQHRHHLQQLHHHLLIISANSSNQAKTTKIISQKMRPFASSASKTVSKPVSIPRKPVSITPSIISSRISNRISSNFLPPPLPNWPKQLLLPVALLIQILATANVGRAEAARNSAGDQQQHFSRHYHRNAELLAAQQAAAIGGQHQQQHGGGSGAAAAILLATGGHAQRLNRCYSCMSPLYEQLFKDGDLGSFFYEPRNFTSQCDGARVDTRGIGLVPCRGICLSLAQEFVIMGRKTGKRLWMRGCAHSLSRHGYQNRTIAYFAEFDLCRDVQASELFRLSSSDQASSEADHFGGNGGGAGFMAGPMDAQTILVCSCLGDRCNSVSSGTEAISGNRRHHHLIMIVATGILLPLLMMSRIFHISFY